MGTIHGIAAEGSGPVTVLTVQRGELAHGRDTLSQKAAAQSDCRMMRRHRARYLCVISTV